MRLLIENVMDCEFIKEEVEGRKSYVVRGPFMMAEVQNRNGRIYPKQILMREANRYIDTYVKHNRAYGELDHPACVSEVAELLTTSGWKYLKDVNEGELIYTLNPLTQKIEIQPVSIMNKTPFKGKMLRLKNRTFNTLVTSNHRFPIIQRNGKPGFIMASEIKRGIDENIASLAKLHIPRSPEFSETISNRIMKIGKHEIPFDMFVSFFGLWLAEGHITYRKGRKNSFIVGISQKDGEKANHIDGLLSKLPMMWNRQRKGSKSTWISHDIDLATFLCRFGKSHEKFIPQDLLTTLDGNDAQLMLSWYALGDGRRRAHNKDQIKDIFSVSKQLMEDMSVVAIKAGYSVRFHTYTETNDVVIENRIIKAKNKRPLHFVQLMYSNGIYLDKRHLSVTEEDYEGLVMCPTVDNGTFLARENGYTFWSGNSPNVNLKYVSHLITDLKEDGNNFIGTAKLVDTPSGQTAKALIDAGARLGVSSRGVGNIENRSGRMYVKEDFHLITPADLVADPSAPQAFVDSVFESAEWVLKNGAWVERYIEDTKEKIDNSSRGEDRSQAMTEAFQDFLKKLGDVIV